MNSFKVAQKLETTQDLSAGALSLALSDTHRDLFVSLVGLHMDGQISETVTVKLTSPTGANYVYLIDSSTLSSGTDYILNPSKPILVPAGWTFTLACTNGNTPSVTAYASIIYQER